MIQLRFEPTSTQPGREKKRSGSGARALRGGLSTELHLLTDALGQPVRALLTLAERVLADLRPAYLVADRGYDARTWRTYLAARGTLAVIPAQRKRSDTAYTPSPLRP